MMRDSDGRIGKVVRISLLLLMSCSALATGCETRVISAKGIGTERYRTQPSFEEEYPPPWDSEKREEHNRYDLQR